MTEAERAPSATVWRRGTRCGCLTENRVLPGQSQVPRAALGLASSAASASPPMSGFVDRKGLQRVYCGVHRQCGRQVGSAGRLRSLAAVASGGPRLDGSMEAR
jgi:hypothetical protein